MGQIASTFSKNQGSLGKRTSSDDAEDSNMSGSSNKRVRKDMPTVLEKDVGITAYVHPDLPSFHCILKHRKEDFLVNEVDMEGNTVHLTNFDQPSLKPQTDEPKMTDDERDAKVAALFDDKVAAEFRDFLAHPDDIDRLFEVKATQEQRMGFYDLVARLGVTLKSSARNELLTVCWPENNDDFGRTVYIDFDKLGNYLQFTVLKTGSDTMNAVHTIAKSTRTPLKHIGYAGTKDARAITVQSMTISRGRPERFLAAREELERRGIYVGDLKFVKQGLTLGDHGGNRFTIVLRDVTGADEATITKSLEELKAHGFLNYFGMQRFGTGTIMTHEIGRCMMKKDFAKATDLILMPRPGDNEGFDRARQKWKETRDAEATLALMPKRANVEIKLLRSYERFPEDHFRALKCLPRSMYTMYIHAYQSYIWNRVVSERSRRHGCTAPLLGDLVLAEQDKGAANKTNKSQKNNNVGRRDPSVRKVPIVLTKDNIDKYTIHDVVYPLPGTRSVYPDNDIGLLFKQFMDEDGIEFNKKDNFYSDFAGDYRCMMAMPKDLSWTFIRYDDPTEKLFNTDLDRAQGNPEPTGVANGQHLALRTEFTLGTSQYATMALREIMRSETASQSQAKLKHS
ncbi:pseudouridine synthase [Gongronella butleri]|nr:pseudouridine synthase [Gongronella butleri]